MHRRTFVPGLVVGLGILALTACTAPAATEAPADAAMAAPTSDTGAMTATVAFAKPAAGESVASPVEVCLTAEGVVIEKSGEIVPGSGHHHLLVDPSVEDIQNITAVPALPIGKDETHIHMGDGASCYSLELAAGEHTLVAVVADGAHFPLLPPVTSTITFVVQ
jgi:hypothetical protein